MLIKSFSQGWSNSLRLCLLPTSDVLGNVVLTCDRTDSTAFLAFDRASSDFTRPMSSARNTTGRFAKSLAAAAAGSVNEAAQGHRSVRMKSRRRYLYAARRS
jgi:hypothetical protein